MRICFWVLFVLMTSGVASRAAPITSGQSQRTVALRPKLNTVVRADPRTGQFVKTVTITPRLVVSRVVEPVAPWAEPAATESAASRGMLDSGVRDLVEKTARQYAVSPALVDSVIQVESNYNSRAVSPKGAQGLMQLMPATARRFGVRNTFDPKDNIEGGVRYLKFLQETFQDERLAIAAYNAGEGSVQKYGNVPPYAETMTYVAKVGKKYGEARRAELTKKVVNASADRPLGPPEPRPIAKFVDAEGRLHITTR
jgi:transglycosylase-like protein with SLT domain